MKLIIGLGNPGKKYEKNRHNTGFILLDELKKILNFPDFSFSNKFDADMAEGTADNTKIMLVKPQTFMNRSGESVKKIMDFYKLSPRDITVIHDDLDIDFGTHKTSTDASSAGHNGIEDIIQKIGTQEFTRIRVGIEGTEKRKTRTVPGDVFVLEDFSDEELEMIKNIAKDIRV